MIKAALDYKLNYFEIISLVFVLLYYGSVVVIGGGEINFFNKLIYPFYVLFLFIFLISKFYTREFISYEYKKIILFIWCITIYLNYSIIGNFPYNISTQILFKVLENRNSVDQVVGMFQKEVAERICSKPNSKKYGILSVLIQAYFNCNLLFDVAPDNFQPKPKVYSSVLKLSRNKTKELDCNHSKFLTVVKAGFSQRRKKLKNALKKIINLEDTIKYNIMNKRAEELSVNEFIKLTNLIFPKS